MAREHASGLARPVIERGDRPVDFIFRRRSDVRLGIDHTGMRLDRDSGEVGYIEYGCSRHRISVAPASDSIAFVRCRHVKAPDDHSLGPRGFVRKRKTFSPDLKKIQLGESKI